MGCLRVFFLVFMIGITGLGLMMTFGKSSAQALNHPNGVSLREESVQAKPYRTMYIPIIIPGRSGGTYGTGSRSHSGGGLSFGK